MGSCASRDHGQLLFQLSVIWPDRWPFGGILPDHIT